MEHTRYEFLQTLERRGNGEVLMLAERHERHGLAGTVVIKHLRTPSDAIRRHRLAEEVQLAYRLHHPSIAQVHFFKIHQGEPYVIMEHVDGPSLETVLGLMAMRRAPGSPPCSPSTSRRRWRTHFTMHIRSPTARAGRWGWCTGMSAHATCAWPGRVR